MHVPKGIVYLVGAGPGDSRLITVRGRARLRQADVVVYDRLIPRALLRQARPDARLIDVGKTPDRAGITQRQINDILMREASDGRAVVRLKGGDPFVFGRGFEELAACRTAGIRCVVIPGVTSAIAVPAAAGIPVTHRGMSRTVAFVTARSRAEGEDKPLDFAALSAMETLVVMMGRSALSEFTKSLIAAGRAPETPAACIERGTTSRQRVVHAALADLADAVDRERLQAPVVTIIGDVAALGDAEIDGFAGAMGGDRPLSGVRIAVTRANSSSSELVSRLREEGADVVAVPLISIVYPRQDAFVAALTREPRYDWIVLTSLHGARALLRTLAEARLDARALAGSRIAAVGPATARALKRIGIRPDLTPNDCTATALAESLGPVIRNRRVLLPRSDIALPELPRRLRDCGAEVDEIVAYHTQSVAPPPRAIAALRAGVDAIVLCSPSAVRSFAESRLDAGQAAIVCIGPTTADAARSAGLRVALVARPHTSSGLTAALIDHFSSVGVQP